ncbi:Fe2+ transport system protein A [Spongiibacter sp. IMCC21906]|jgi:ferrous iron transport protein A|uniref:FeoA family protein n=1 Tax=Spongiibacter sp. IMCC21906 TaxID=1620392 RepID=UPI00062DFD5C|nr:FeoA family protein [Spongiibacter sp. IMCC21906]AKH69557.1 Fe2+ transport system protein A [Spongiibacter sp. IMCC21906]
MILNHLQKGQFAVVAKVDDAYENDPISHRMRELGFISGARIRLVTKSVWGGNTLVIQLGNTRFALRKQEAQRITLTSDQ